jgi:hypothetical protein
MSNINKIIKFNTSTLRFELRLAQFVFGFITIMAPLVVATLCYINQENISIANAIRFGAAYAFCIFLLRINVLEKENSLRLKLELDSGRLKAVQYMSSGRFKHPYIHLTISHRDDVWRDGNHQD